MSAVKFFLFGKFSFEVDGKLFHRIEPRKAEELLGFLLLYRDQSHSREKLADLLWGEISPDQANKYLRKALWQLQTDLEQYRLNEKGLLLLVEGEWLKINPDFEFWLDVSTFEEAYKRSQGGLGRNLEDGQVRMIQRATEIYRGELLEGWYQDWCLYERERLQHQYLTMLDKLMDYCEIHQRYEEGLLYGEKILRLDRAREHTHRRIPFVKNWTLSQLKVLASFLRPFARINSKIHSIQKMILKTRSSKTAGNR